MFTAILVAQEITCEYIPAGPLTAPHHSLVGDWNGNGQDDLLLAAPSGSQYFWRLHRQARQHDEWLSSVTDSLGNQTQLLYKPLSDGTFYQGRTDAVFPQLDWRGPRHAVSQLKQSNGIGGLNETQFEYRDARIDLLGRGFLGFAQVIRKVPERKQVLTSKLRQDFPYIGALSEETLAIDGKTISRKSIQYQSKVTGKLHFVAPEAVNEERFELDGQAVGATRQQYQYDSATGNLLDESSEQRPSLAGAWIQRSQVKRQYQNDTANWLLGFVTREERILESAGAPVQTTVTQLTPVPGTLAVAREVRFAGLAGLQQTFDHLYDAQGNLAQTTYSAEGGPARVTRYEDYAAQRFPQRIINPLGHITARTYALGTGQVTSETDANGLVSNSAYDGFGRSVRQQRADGGLVTTAYEGCASGCLPREKYRVLTRTLHASNSAQGAPDQRSHHDSLGRKLRETKQGFDGRQVFQDYGYDEWGNQVRATQPYYAGSAAPTDNFRHDALNRVIFAQTASGAQITTLYAARSGGGSTIRKTRQFSRDGQAQTQVEIREQDAAGRLLVSTNAAGSPLAVRTRYGYDSAGNLTRTEVDGDSRTTVQMAYDLAGNRTALRDPNSGPMTYRYDGYGMLRETTGPGMRIEQDYDLLGRLTQRRDYQGGQLIDTAHWDYDKGNKALGKLSGQYKADGSFVQGYVYDGFGRLQARSTELKTGGQTRSYSDSYSYDAFSRPLKTTWASGLVVQHRYNAYGYAIGESNAADGKRLRAIEAQNARGQNTKISYGNGVVSQYRYNEAGGWLDELDSQGPEGQVQGLRYQHDPIGLLFSRSDVRGYSERFSYDALQRLSTSQRILAGQTLVGNYSYDALGNLTSNPQAGVLSYGQYAAAQQSSCQSQGGIAQPGPHAVLSSNSGAYCYDARGNQLSGPGRKVSYSVFDKPLSIASGGQTSLFQYDPERRRFYQQAANRTTFYLDEGQFEEVIEAGKTVQNTYVGSYLQHQKDVASGTVSLKYQLRDQLGSVDVVLDAQGKVLERLAYAPFGGLRGADWSDTAAPMKESRRGFTDHEHLQESGLIHMNGRVYDPALSRFLSADIVYQDATNAQMFNRYSYLFNLPFAGTDPSGYFASFNWYDFPALFEAPGYTAPRVDMHGSTAYAGFVPIGSEGTLTAIAYSPIMAPAAGYLAVQASGLSLIAGSVGRYGVAGALGTEGFHVGGILLAETTLGVSVGVNFGGRLVPNSLERSLGSFAGHRYASDILEGGTGTAYAGHGQYRFGSGDFVVPEGTAITLPREGIRITDKTGQFIEAGDWEGLAAAARINPRIANDIEGMATWLSGTKIPNYSLSAPNNPPLTIFRNSATVEYRTPLSELLRPNMGCVQWAACTEFSR